MELPKELKVKRWPKRTRSKVKCLEAGVFLFFGCLAFGVEENFKIYAKARDGKREFYDAMRGLMMVDEALVRNLKQARTSR